MDVIVRKPSETEKTSMKKEPIWECEPKTFTWYYDEQETCLILEGCASVKAENKEISFNAGDLVIFPKGLSCEWTVTKKIKKHYKFGN